jgi:hypothetical protein
MTNEPHAAAPAEIVERVRERTRHERQRRVWRALLLGVLVTALMVLLAVLNRDTQQLRLTRRVAVDIVSKLQAQFEHEGQPPLQLPDLPQHGRYAEGWFMNLLYAEMARASRPVGVACLRRPAPMFLQATGRYVILFDRERYYSEWWTQPEFEARAAGLGFGPLLTQPGGE